MKEVLETIIKNLVDTPEAVDIKEVEGEKNIIFEVKVAEKDFGKIIGRQGKIAKAIKTLSKALGAKEGRRVEIEFP